MELIEVVIACLGSSGLTAIILAVLQRKWAYQDKQSAIVAALKVLTVDRVRYLGRCYIKDQSISLEDKENLEDMYRTYKVLGGYGHLETAMDEVERLPVQVQRGDTMSKKPNPAPKSPAHFNMKYYQSSINIIL